MCKRSIYRLAFRQDGIAFYSKSAVYVQFENKLNELVFSIKIEIECNPGYYFQVKPSGRRIDLKWRDGIILKNDEFLIL